MYRLPGLPPRSAISRCVPGIRHHLLVTTELRPTMTPWLSVESAKAKFEAFLTAPIGEESNGMTLSVLSGLSRLDLDPWGEAAWLSQQPKEIATAALGQRIARLPRGKWQLSDTAGIAARLVELLPGQDATRAGPGDLPVVNKKRPAFVLWLIAAGLALCLLLDVPAHVGRLLISDVPPAASLSSAR